MKITYTAKNVNLRDNFKERVEKKLRKYERVFSDDAEVKVTVNLYKNRQTVEITIRDNGMVYRVESSAAEMNDALDTNIDKLGRQIRKNKTKLEKRLRPAAFDAFVADEEELSDEEVMEELTKLNDEGEIKGCVIDGPLSMDIALYKEAAEEKGALDRKVAGDADILVFPDIHAGNLVYKTIVHMVPCKNGNILTGTKAPVILTSRSDTVDVKVNSIALAAVVAERINANK